MDIQKQFSKHYKRLENDLKQIQGVTPLMLNIVSLSFKKLEEDVLSETKERENEDKFTTL